MERLHIILVTVILFVLTTACYGQEDKSGVRPQVLSLPSGPGSIEGLGESFEPQLNSGTGSYSIALKTPPARVGFSPSVVFSYNGGNGNSELGLGWKLNIPYIQRQTDKGVPTYSTEDTFVTQQGEELVAVGDSHYRLENESSFERYTQTVTGNVMTWYSISKSGVTNYYGEVQSAQLRSGDHQFAWYLTRQSDLNGNEINYYYNESDSFSQGQSPDNDLKPYLTRISYNSLANSDSVMSVVFHYEPRADGDLPLDFRSRLPVIISQRLSQVVMFEGDNRIRSYRLNYQEGSVSSRLVSVEEFGRDEELGALESVLSMTYTGLEFSHQLIALQGEQQPEIGLSNGHSDLVDMNGDALPDVLQTQNGHQVYFNLDGQQWSQQTQVDEGFGEVKLEDQNTFLMDMNGDGFSDLFVQDQSINGYKYFPGGQSNNGWASIPVEMSQSPGFVIGQNVKTLDVDNDGRIDILHQYDFSLDIVFNREGTSFSSRFTLDPPSFSSTFDFNEGLRLGDINGDGLQDFVVFKGPGEIWYFPGRGVTLSSETPEGLQGWDRTVRNWPDDISGSQGSWLTNAPDTADEQTFSDLDTFRQLQLIDVNGDGLSDLVHIGNNYLKIWLNYGGQFFSDEPIEIASNIPDLGQSVQTRAADMNANGTVDIVWNRQSGFAESGFPNASWIYLDFSPEERPNLLKTIDNGIGLVTTISYKPAIQDRIAQRGTGDDWQTKDWAYKLPIAVNVLAETQVFDGSQTYTTRFHYKDGFYDGVEKEFRGFETAIQTEVGDDSAPSLYLEYTYHTGVVNEARKGRQRTLIVKNEKEEVFFEERFQWQVIDFCQTEAGETTLLICASDKDVSWAYQSQRDKSVIEKGAPEESVTLSWEYEYDHYGNNTLIIENGRADEGWDDERHTINSFSAGYAAGLENWILDKIITSTTTDEHGTKISEQRLFYDNNTELGEISAANMTLQEDWVAGELYINTVRNTYDSWGNVLRIEDPNYIDEATGHYRTIEYDDTYKLFPVSETIVVDDQTSLVTTAEYDAGFGVVTASVDFNGHQTDYEYDNFARLLSMTKPGDTLPTIEYDYVLAFDLGEGNTINWVETRQRESTNGGTVDSRKFYDGLGRHVMTRAEGELPGQVVVSDTVQFNQRKTPYRKYLPYFETVNDPDQHLLDFIVPNFEQAYTEHFYDALGREIRMNQPDGSFSQITYLPMVREIKDEEQTQTSGRHSEGAMRYEEDGLLNNDGKGRLRRVTEIFSNDEHWLTEYRYDLLDNLTSYTDSQGNQKHMTYDGLSRKVTMNDPDRGVMIYEYDDASNLISTLDAKNQTISMTYDGANRLLTETYGADNTDPDVVYHYDKSVSVDSFGDFWLGENRLDPARMSHALLMQESLPEYDVNRDNTFDVADIVSAQVSETSLLSDDNQTTTNSLGQLVRVQDTAGEAVFSYDERGRTSWTRRSITDHSDRSHHFYTGMRYDSMDRMTELVYPDGSFALYHYNTRGLLESSPGIFNKLDYNPAGQNLLLSRANEVTTEYQYDQRLRLSQIQSTAPQSLILQDLNYTYDAVSNMISIEDGRTTETLTGIGEQLGISQATAKAFNATQNFSYDNLYRLTQAKNDLVYGDISYQYDQIGNMISKVANLLTADPLMNLGTLSHGGDAGASNRDGRAAGDAPGPHALTEWGSGDDAQSIEYDDNGNTISERGQQYSWDIKDRLNSMQKANTQANYQYDYQDSRKYKHVQSDSDTNEVFYIDKFAEVRNGQLIKYAYAGTQRIARSELQDNNIFTPETFYLHDHLGSTNLATNTSGQVTEHIANYPFGRVRLSASFHNSPQSDYRFTGKEKDNESELQYFEARYLGVSGQFLTYDMSVKAQQASSLNYPKQLNYYIYASQNPLLFKDDSGDWIHLAIGAGVGGITNAAIEIATAKIQGNPINYGKVATEFVIGAGTGALSGGISHLSKIKSLSKVVSTKFGNRLVSATKDALSMGLDAAESAGRQFMDNGNVDLKQVFFDAGFGAFTGGAVGDINSRNTKTFLKSRYQSLAKQRDALGFSHSRTDTGNRTIFKAFSNDYKKYKNDWSHTLRENVTSGLAKYVGSVSAKASEEANK